MLKTDSGYRIASLSHWGYVMLSRCTAALDNLEPDWRNEPNKALNNSKQPSAWILQLLEPNESVTIIAPNGAMKKPTIRQITDTFERRANRPVIGICHPQEYYDQIRGADVKDETE